VFHDPFSAVAQLSCVTHYIALQPTLQNNVSRTVVVDKALSVVSHRHEVVAASKQQEAAGRGHASTQVMALAYR